MKGRRSLIPGRGLTLVECMVAAALIAVMLAVSYRFYTTTKTVWAYVFVQGQLEREAMLALERMIHGVDTDNIAIGGQQYNSLKGIQEARSIVTPAVGGSASQIEFEDQDFPGTSRLFFLQNSKLVYTDDLNNSKEVIDGDVQALTFTRPSSNIIQIDLTLQRAVLKRVISVNVTSSIELRNL